MQSEADVGGPSAWFSRMMADKEILVGAAFGAITIGVAFLGPLVAPHDPIETIGAPFDHDPDLTVFGTDVLGRDVLSRVLWGGRSLILVSVGATVLGYLVGLAVGLAVGYGRGWLSALTLRSVDVLLSFPPLLFLLLVATGAGKSTSALMIAIAVIHVPSVVRIVQAATMEQRSRSFVEAAVMRGETTGAILFREILPNIARPLAADAGLRLTWSVLLISSASYLSLGITPPTPNWALMISENQSGLSDQPWSVLLPALPIVLMTFSINLMIDGLSRRLGVSKTGSKLL